MAGSSRMPRPGGPGSGRNRPSLPGSPSQRGQRPNLTPPPVVAPPPAVAPRGNTGRLKAPEVAPPPPVVAPPPAARPAGNTARMARPAPTQPPAPAKRSTRQVAPAAQPPAPVVNKPSTRQAAPVVNKSSTRQVAPATQPPAPVAIKPSARLAATTAPKPPAAQPVEEPVEDNSSAVEVDEAAKLKPVRKKLGTFKPLKPGGGDRPALKLALQPEGGGKSRLILIGIAVVLFLLIGGGILLSLISGPAPLIPDDQWRQQTAAEARFTVMLPAAEPLKRQTAAQGFNAAEHSISVSQSGMTFIVRYGKFDGEPPDKQVVYDALAGSLAKMPGVATVGNASDVALHVLAGREQKFTSGANTMIARMAVHEDHYLLLLVEFRGTTAPGEADKFFHSFKYGVIGPPEVGPPEEKE